MVIVLVGLLLIFVGGIGFILGRLSVSQPVHASTPKKTIKIVHPKPSNN